VITEQGRATLLGLSQRDQAQQLIDVTAHPKAREWLWRGAAEPGLVAAESVEQ
jgi:acyl-CoA hydrolase